MISDSVAGFGGARPSGSPLYTHAERATARSTRHAKFFRFRQTYCERLPSLNGSAFILGPQPARRGTMDVSRTADSRKRGPADDEPLVLDARPAPAPRRRPCG